MPDIHPTAEAVRLSNALDNLGSSVIALEGVNYLSEKALVALVSAVYEMTDPGLAAEIFGSLDDRNLRTIIKAAHRHSRPVSFVEAIYAARTQA